MKIISKFQDYYDIGIAYGVDEKLRFERVTKVKEESCGWGEPWSHYIFKNQQWYRVWFFFDIIGFCGDIYPLVHVVIEQNKGTNKAPNYVSVEEQYFYDVSTFESYIKEQVDPKGQIVQESNNYGYSYRRKLNIIAEVEAYFKKDYRKKKMLFSTYDAHYFIEESSVCMKKKYVQTSVQTTIYPQLKKYKFAKVLAPMEAFQKLSMYLGAKNSEKEIVQIDDKYLAEGKGFDCHSFKKLPSKRKVKRC
ncbi:MAG TPA: hypothetical protein ENK98_02865 [Epsilonproteobacteria bacterium]|nr:hypothetical protein [Campylobacterota bacterium]